MPRFQLLPIARPTCPTCKMRPVTVEIVRVGPNPQPLGFQRCRVCGLAKVADLERETGETAT